MLDLRMYKTGLVVVALAALVLAFSLENQQGALTSSLAPDAFNGQNVSATMNRLAREYPDRRPGSNGDNDIADQVAQSFSQYGFNPTRNTFSARTADGQRTLENVVGIRPGMESGSVVVIAHRDSRAWPSTAALSGTATLIELARDLQGETLHRTVILASTSGSQGTAGAIRLASTLAGPIDAVIVLGDLASSHIRQPIIVPWSDGQQVAPPMLRNTVAAAMNQQDAIGSGGTSVFGQFVHLAFPLTLTEQGPFNARGIPAVLLSLSGERGPGPDAPIAGADQLTSVGRGVLSSISALDAGSAVPSSSPYVLFDRKVVPGWAMSVFVLSLIVPVLLTTVDGLARALRRGYRVWRWLAVVLVAAVPLVLGLLVLLASKPLGLLAVVPAGLVPAGAIPLGASGIVALVLAAAVAIGSFLLLRPVATRFAAGPKSTRDAEASIWGATVALLLVACAVTLAIWSSNPYAALVAIPALHLWLLALEADIRMPLIVRIVLVALGLVPIAAVIAYYAVTLGFGPLGVVWSGALLIAGHVISPVTALLWSVFGGCVLIAGAIVVALARQPRREKVPVTIRGPVTYAGPGSLGGTKSAMRR